MLLLMRRRNALFDDFTTGMTEYLGLWCNQGNALQLHSTAPQMVLFYYATDTSKCHPSSNHQLAKIYSNQTQQFLYKY
jgi:hypothetical protein